VVVFPRPKHAPADVRKGGPLSFKKRKDHGMSLSNKFLNPKIEWLFHQEKIHWDHISLTDSHQNFQHRATLSRFLFRRCRGWRQGHSMTCAAHWVQLGVINGYNYGTNLHKLGYGAPTNYVFFSFHNCTPKYEVVSNIYIYTTPPNPICETVIGEYFPMFGQTCMVMVGLPDMESQQD